MDGGASYEALFFVSHLAFSASFDRSCILGTFVHIFGAFSVWQGLRVSS